MGRARPIIRLIVVTNRPGTPIAIKRKPTRTIIVASTSWENRVIIGGKEAKTKNKTPSGHKNQPDLPKSVIELKHATIHRGSRNTALIVAASIKSMPHKNTNPNAVIPAASFPGEPTHDRYGRIGGLMIKIIAPATCTTHQRRTDMARRPAGSASLVAVISLDSLYRAE